MASPNIDIVLKLYPSKLPIGKRDSAGRWYPSDEENASCCDSIRSPSRTHTNSLYKHCLTTKHLRTRLEENPREWEREALTMTVEDAPLYMNHPEGSFHRKIAIALLEKRSP